MKFAVVALCATACGRLGFSSPMSESNDGQPIDAELIDARPELPRFISPTGSNNGDGSLANPWKTFEHAYQQMTAGETLVLFDGVYNASNGSFGRNCALTLQGTQANPAFIRAANQRKARVEGNVDFANCEYLDIDGIEFVGNDSREAAVDIRNSAFTTITNSVIRQASPGSTASSNGVYLGAGHHTTIKNSEIYDFGNYGIVVDEEDDLIEGNYINGRAFRDAPIPTGGNCGGSMLSIGGVLSTRSRTVIASTIVENTCNAFILNSYGVRLDDNLIMNSIAINSMRQGFGVILVSDQSRPQDLRNNAIRNVLLVNTEYGVLNAAEQTRVDNLSVISTGAAAAIAAYNGDNNGSTYSMQVRDIYIDNAQLALLTSNGKEASLTYRNLLYVSETSPPVLSPPAIAGSNLVYTPEPSGSCLVRPASLSPRRGSANTYGASITNRTERGIPTAQPMWDQATGAFPCGAPVASLVGSGDAHCHDVHQRLNTAPGRCL